jgi:hypothetical protein
MSKQESREKPFVPIHTQRSSAVDRDSIQKVRQQQEKQLRMDFALTFNTAEGKRVLKWIMFQSGYGKSPVGGNPALGLDVMQGTLYNAARLGLYTELRQFVPHTVLKQVEFENIDEAIS